MPLTQLSQPTALRIANRRDKENQGSFRKTPISHNRRRRARPAPGSIASNVSSPVAAAEQAAQRASRRNSPQQTTPSPTTQVTITPAQEPSCSTAPPSEPTIAYNFPRTLPRFEIPRVKEEALAAIDEGLKGIPLEYLHDNLRSLQPKLQRGLASVSTDGSGPSRRDLPGELPLLVRDGEGRLPTHILVAMDNNGSKGFMFPFHDLVFVSHCSFLPELPKPTKALVPEVRPNSSVTITLPVVPVRLPNPELFKPIYDYLYNKNSGRLLSLLLPLPPASMPRRSSVPVPVPATSSSSSPSPSPASSPAAEQDDFNSKVSQAMADTFTLQTLVEQARVIHGLWSNVVTLGVADPTLWNVMDYAWSVLLNAMVMSTRGARS